MGSPSPLDRCWVVKDVPGSSRITPAVLAAVEKHWPDAQRSAASVLGDESLAAEIMEGAIEQAVTYLADHPSEDHEDVSAVLSRFCKLEVRRRRKQRAQFVLGDFVSEMSTYSSTISAADAAIDAERILADASPEVREAMMMRYGSSDSWSDVAAKTATSPEAIRKKCKRCIDRIRQRLGILGASQ
jgi:DNA-directed RNA polymerase specialized sigma24 family protein